MKYAIDTVKPVSLQHLLISGWTEKGTISLDINGRRISGYRAPYHRDDLVNIFGVSARHWGFASLFYTETPVIIGQNAHVVIESEGETIVVPYERYPIAENVGPNKSHSIFLEHIASKSSASVAEIGSRARSGNTYKSIFPKKYQYVGIDITAGPNVDVVADAHDLPDSLADKFDFVYSISTFEHLLMPWKVAIEINKILKLGGVAYIQSHASWPIHEEPWDYFRFSKYSWKGLFNQYTGFEILSADHAYKASIVPDLALGGGIVGLSGEATYLISSCAIRKTGAAVASWPFKADAVTDLAYSH